MCPNPQFPAALVTFTEEIFNGKLHFLCSVSSQIVILNVQPRVQIDTRFELFQVKMISI